MKLKRVTAWGLALVMTLSLDVPGVSAASSAVDTTLPVKSARDEQIDLVVNQKKLPGTTRTFFDEADDIRDWFNVSGYVAEGVQDRSQYYDEYVANGYKNTKNYIVVEEDGYWEKTTEEYITEEAYEKLTAEEKENYRFVTAEEQFTTALNIAPSVIQVNAEELELGFHYLQDNNIPTGPISMVTDYENGSKKAAPITNPVIMHEDDKYGMYTLYKNDKKKDMDEYKDIKGTGVSDVSLYSNLTLFSTTGCIIRHAGLDVGGCNDIIVRNFRFEGMYEWDDQTVKNGGNEDYTTRKRYGWCNVSGNDSDNIWIDHCTFGYAFDGNLDFKNGSSFSVTWCQFGVQDISTNNETPVTVTNVDGKPQYSGTRWSESNGSELWKNILFMEEIYQKYKAGLIEEGNQYYFYTKYRDQGATPQEILRYAAMHSKVHLGGSGESSYYTNVDEKITLGFNYYTSVIQRVPMIRQGNGHMYNCIVDNTDFTTTIQACQKRGISFGYSSFISVNNARDGASIGSDTCIFKEVEPCTGVEYQGMEDQSKTIGETWQSIISPMVNHNVVVNSKVIKSDGTNYKGSSWDNDGENLFTKSKWKWEDKSSLGDFKWSKWKNQDELAKFSTITNRLEGDENLVFKYIEEKNDPSAYYNDFYEGSYELGYDYQCFDLDDVESKVMTYGGATKNLYGAEETPLDYIQPYNQASVRKDYGEKVTIDTNGAVVEGKANNVYYVKNGENIELPTAAEMTKEGYTFEGWKKGTYEDGQLVLGDFLAAPDEKVIITAPDDGCIEETYYAIWKINTFQITFNSMGGSEVSDVVIAEYNQTIRNAGGFPESPTKEGATFLGWYKFETETQTYGVEILRSAQVKSDMVLYARWKNTISFNTDGGTAIADKKVDSGKTVSVADPVKEGYTFEGWYTDPEFTEPFDVQNDKVMEPMTLYAKFVLAAVTVSFETGFDDVTVGAIQVAIGATGSAIVAVDPPVATDDSIEFKGWYMEEECTTPFDPEAVITQDMTLYAKWGAKALLGDVNGDGEIKADDALAILKHVVGIEQEKFIAEAGDVNNDGDIKADDALAVLKHVVGIIQDFSEIQQPQ